MYFKGKITCRSRTEEISARSQKRTSCGHSIIETKRLPVKAWLGGSMDDIVAMMRPEVFEICKPLQREKLAATNFSALKPLR